MSVIISRALPDVRDGLKPSQRRILVAMRDLGLTPGGVHQQVRGHRRRDDEAVPPARGQLDLSDPGPHGPVVEHAAPADHRPGELRQHPRPAAGGDAVHRGQAQPGRRRDARGHPARHRRLPAQLRREVPGAAGPARQVPQPAGQRLRRHRRGDGDLDPAPQPRRGLRRPDRLHRRPGDRARRADGDHPRPRFPHRRDDLRQVRPQRGLSDRPGPGDRPGQVRDRGAQGRPQPDHLHRDPLPAHQGDAAQEAGGAGQRRPDHRRVQHRRLQRPQAAGADRRHRQEGRRPQRRRQPALRVLAAPGHLQRDHAGPGRRPAQDAAAQGASCGCSSSTGST